MIVIGDRAQTLPAPPQVVTEALLEPRRAGGRGWLDLWSGEHDPSEITRTGPGQVRWSSIWREHPEVVIEFEATTDGHGGSRLRFVLSAAESTPEKAGPDEAAIGQLRYRMNRLVFGDLRLSFGQ